MPAINPYVDQYKKNQIETATPEQVLILLYDGAIQFLTKAKIAINENDPTRCCKELFSCQRIILEFMNTLNMELGGELAQNLYKLYEYLFNTLVELNISKDLDKIEEILDLLKGLRDTWQKAIVVANSEKKTDLIDNYNGQTYDDEYDEDEN